MQPAQPAPATPGTPARPGVPSTPAAPAASMLAESDLAVISTTTPDGTAAIEAESALVDAIVHLREIRRAALFGWDYDPELYDAAIITYRRARAASKDARLAWCAAVRSLYSAHPAAA